MPVKKHATRSERKALTVETVVRQDPSPKAGARQRYMDEMRRVMNQLWHKR